MEQPKNSMRFITGNEDHMPMDLFYEQKQRQSRSVFSRVWDGLVDLCFEEVPQEEHQMVRPVSLKQDDLDKNDARMREYARTRLRESKESAQPAPHRQVPHPTFADYGFLNR